MNGKGVVLMTEELVYPINNKENEQTETKVFETVQIESITVSEIKTENQGTRFARLKKILRKRSASIL